MSQTALPLGPPVDPNITLQAPAESYVGKDVTLERIDGARHGPGLFAALKDRPDLWTYMLDPPSETADDLVAMLKKRSSHDPSMGNIDAAGNPTLYFYAIVQTRQQGQSQGVGPEMLGYIALFRLDYAHRTGEIGHVMLLPKLQRTRGATEAHALLMRAAFEDVGVRRLEWKCNDLNAPSRRAALRLGYVFEGIFRKHYIVKGHSRDTAWFSITDDEWPVVKTGLYAWLAPSNFDAEGRQAASLDTLRERAKTAGVARA